MRIIKTTHKVRQDVFLSVRNVFACFNKQ